MNFFVRLFLLFLEKLGRHEVLVGAYGKIYWHRYYIFYRDRMDNPRWIDYLPNAYIHIFESEEPDGEDEHCHAWSSLSFMFKGQYIESINHNKERTTKAGQFSFLSYKNSHRLKKAEIGTTTLFMHGWRRADWKFFVKPHEVICDFCVKENNGVCHKKEQVMNFTEYMNRGEGKETAYGKNRTMAWTLYNDEFKKKLERRKAAAEKLGLKTPDTKMEARAAITKLVVQRKK
jgi:hypothetical protein